MKVFKCKRCNLDKTKEDNIVAVSCGCGGWCDLTIQAMEIKDE